MAVGIVRIRREATARKWPRFGMKWTLTHRPQLGLIDQRGTLSRAIGTFPFQVEASNFANSL